MDRPALVLTLGVTTAAGWAVLARDAGDTVSFGCTTSDGNVTSVLPNDGTSPVDACAAEWVAGAMVAGVTAAPPLVACVHDGGAVTVIPGSGERPCELAGMAPWTDLADFEAIGQAVRAARVTLFDRLSETGDGCAEEAEWRDLLGVARSDRAPRTLVLTGTPGSHSIGCDPRTGC